MSIEIDGMVNPDAKAIWNTLGFEDTPDAGHMLDGLFTEDRIYVVNPPAPFEGTTQPSPGRAR